MMGLSLNKGLLWKEWTQHKLKILASFIILSYSTMWEPIINIILMLTGRLDVSMDNMAAAWSHNIPWILGATSGTLEMVGIFIAGAFGVVILNHEKMENTLEFTLTKPFSRKDIIFNKFIFGVLVFTGIVVLNGLFLIAASLILPALYSIADVLLWCVILIPGLSAIYTFGLLIATLINGRLAILVTFFLLYLPHVIKEILIDVFYVHEIPSNYYLSAINITQKIANLITLPWYLDVQNRTFRVYTENSLTIHTDAIQLHIDIPFLILLILGMQILAIWLFEKNSMERQKEFFMFKIIDKVWKVSVAITLGVFLTGISRYEFGSLAIGLVTGVVTIVITMVGFSLLSKVKKKIFN